MKAKPRTVPSVSPANSSPAQPRRRVLLVDDHPMMRAGLAHLIERQPDLTVCGEAANPAEALKTLPAAQPDIVLADLTMPGRSGLEFVKDVLAILPTLPILIVSMHDEAVYAERALRAGARGYIMKEAGGEAVIVAIRQILSGQVYVSPTMSARILENLSGNRSSMAYSSGLPNFCMKSGCAMPAGGRTA
jgi:DNA-binding NarL/FixJ family response regulator